MESSIRRRRYFSSTGRDNRRTDFDVFKSHWLKQNTSLGRGRFTDILMARLNKDWADSKIKQATLSRGDGTSLKKKAKQRLAYASNFRPGKLLAVPLSSTQRVMVDAMGFGPLFKYRCNTSYRSFILSLCMNFNPIRRTLKIHDQTHVLDTLEVGRILGIPYKGAPLPTKAGGFVAPKDSCGRYCGIKFPVFFDRLLHAGLYDEKQFLVDLLVLIIGSFLFPTGSEVVQTTLLPMLHAIDNCSSYNWAQSVLQFMCDSISRYRRLLHCKRNSGSNGSYRTPRVINGCVHVLLIFYLELYFPDEKRNYNDVTPIVYWTDSIIRQKLRQISKEKALDLMFSQAGVPACGTEGSHVGSCVGVGYDSNDEACSISTSHKQGTTSDTIYCGVNCDQRVSGYRPNTHVVRKLDVSVPQLPAVQQRIVETSYTSMPGDAIVARFGDAIFTAGAASAFIVPGSRLRREDMDFSIQWVNYMNTRKGRHVHVMPAALSDMICDKLGIPKTFDDNLWDFKPQTSLNIETLSPQLLQLPYTVVRLKDLSKICIPCCLFDHWFVITLDVPRRCVQIFDPDEHFIKYKKKFMLGYIHVIFVRIMSQLLSDIASSSDGYPGVFRFEFAKEMHIWSMGCPEQPKVIDSAPWVITYLRCLERDAHDATRTTLLCCSLNEDLLRLAIVNCIRSDFATCRQCII